MLIGMMFMISSTLIGQSSKTIPKVSEKDTLTINVISENPKIKLANENLSVQLAKSVDNQTIVNTELATSISKIASTIENLISINSSPPTLKEFEYYKEFGYDSNKIRKAIRRFNSAKYILIAILSFFFVYLMTPNGIEYSQHFIKGLVRRVLLLYAVYLAVLYSITFIFNPTYWDIIKLSKLII